MAGLPGFVLVPEEERALTGAGGAYFDVHAGQVVRYEFDAWLVWRAVERVGHEGRGEFDDWNGVLLELWISEVAMRRPSLDGAPQGKNIEGVGPTAAGLDARDGRWGLVNWRAQCPADVKLERSHGEWTDPVGVRRGSPQSEPLTLESFAVLAI